MPPVRQTLSKSRVTRAGDTIRAWWELGEEEEVTPEGLEAARVMAAWRQLHAYPLSLVTPGVRHWVSQETAGRVIVGQRLKRFDRMLDKLSRMPTLRLPQMEDIAGCRAVLLDPAEVDAVAYRIRRRWDVRQTSDYRLFGKPVTAYRALHLIVMRRERLVEVQLRTMGQQYWAEAV